MNFSSDNVGGIAPEILAALIAVNDGAAPAYGEDDVTRRLEAQLAEIFEHQVAVFSLATGTAANALALASLTPAWGAVYCHEASHVIGDEANAPEFFSAGAKLVALPGASGKITAETLEAALKHNRGGINRSLPAAVSLSQATEAGTVYRPEEIATIAEIAHGRSLKLHMDGARFANAVAFLGVSPSTLSWRAGIDVLSLGATKNGALAAEMVVFFDPADARDFAYRRKRAGHLLSKQRFLSAQLEAYFSDGLWLRNAAHANAAAQRLARGLSATSGATVRYGVEANEVFVDLPEQTISGLLGLGYLFYRWDERCIRLVTRFDTPDASVDRLIADATALARS